MNPESVREWASLGISSETHADEEGDCDKEERVREERVDGEEEKHCARTSVCDERVMFGAPAISSALSLKVGSRRM